MPEHPPELRQAWIRALHRDNIDNLKVVNVCVKHFREEDVEVSHKLSNGDGTFTEIPRAEPKLIDCAVPCLLPGCSSYYSLTSTTKRTCLSYDAKEELMNQTLQLSLLSESEEKHKYIIRNLQDLKAKLILIALPDTWLVLYSDNHNTRFIHPNMVDRTVSVDLYLEVNNFLSVSAWFHGQSIPLSVNSINDIRQIESILHEISLNLSLILVVTHIHTIFLLPKNI